MESIEALVGKATHFSTHSGEVGAGGIFIALRGSSRDGHAFVPELLKKGILAAIVEKDFHDPRAIVVKDTGAMHWNIASLFRDKFKGPVIGVGGSSGKTSTKEILYQVLSQKYNCIKTDKSQNGLLGIPRTLEKLRPGVEVAIVEIGIDAPGDMARNVSLVRPTHALLTSIGEEHLNLLKNLEGVFAEERILLDETLKRGGTCYCPSTDAWLAKLSQVKKVPASPIQIDSTLVVDQKDKHVLQNMALAVAVARDLSMKVDEINSAFKNLSLPDGRGIKWKVSDNLWVIRDHYNANPSSMGASFESASQFAQEKKLELRLILGDMLDLGAESARYHGELVKKARMLGAHKIIWIGPEFKKTIGVLGVNEFYLNSSSDELSPSVISACKEPGVVLVKGSRGMALENAMDRIFGNYKLPN